MEKRNGVVANIKNDKMWEGKVVRVRKDKFIGDMDEKRNWKKNKLKFMGNTWERGVESVSKLFRIKSFKLNYPSN